MHIICWHEGEEVFAMTEAERLKTLARITRLARLMDTAWRIPLTRIRFGLDSVLGLVPGAGDAVNLVISTYALLLAHRLGAPRGLILRMAGNTAIDFGLGSIPILGDVFDLFFKSNTRNLRMLSDYLERNGMSRR
jgi:Domain of unknown function (DUF4112)